jgi:hypothetical protein
VDRQKRKGKPTQIGPAVVSVQKINRVNVTIKANATRLHLFSNMREIGSPGWNQPESVLGL